VRVFSSRYQNGAVIADSSAVPVRITRFPPRWKLTYKLGGSILELAPTEAEFRIGQRREFTTAYNARLDGLGCDAVLGLLTMVSDANDGGDLVLLCFEDVRSGDWCHRQVLAEWLESRCGLVVGELEDSQTSFSPLSYRVGKHAPATPDTRIWVLRLLLPR
jgi:hypothetical protein